jgi:type I restriction enzyme R subunit
MSQGEAFSRVKIDAQLKDVGWNLTDGRSVRYDYPLDDRTRADYVLCDRQGSSLAVLEAKRASINPVEAEAQAKRYAGALKVPYVFLANGEAVWFWEWEHEAHPRAVKTVFSQADLERRAAVRTLRRDPFDVPIDNRIVNRGYQHDCIDVLCRQIKQGRRKLLVEMATGTGKTRTIIALIQRLFDANVITRVLFLVDRNTLAIQAENAFNDHLPDQPCYRVPRTGQRFQDWKRITIVTLQTMINEYPNYSSGYFDLVITDECHRSIYGQWSGVLRHFDGIQIGLTATPCIVRDADRLPDPEDGAFVRAISSPTAYTRRRPSRRPPKRASRSAVTSSTGRPWTLQPRKSSRSCSARPRPSRSTRRRSSADSRSPSATGRWYANIVRCSIRASPAGMACAGRRSGARQSSSP